MAVAGSRLMTRLFAVAKIFAAAGSLRQQPRFGSCRKLLQWSYDQTSVVPLSPSATKNSPNATNASTPPHKKANNGTGCNSLGQDKLRQPKGKMTPLDKRENPVNCTKPRISVKSNMLTGNLHLVALKRQTSLVLLPLKKKGRKKGSSPLGESQVPSTTRQNMSSTANC